MKKIISFIVATILMVGFIYCVIRAGLATEMVANISSEQKINNSEDFETILCNQDANVYLKWWYNKSDERYYFFVPKNLSFSWKFIGAEYVNINSEIVQNGEVFSLNDGTYTLQIEKNGNVKKYPICVMYSSEIDTLFLETNSGSMETINSDIEKEENGSYAFVSVEDALNISSGAIKAIHARGNASWRYTDKKSYQMELDKETEFAGLGNGEKWILIANAFDETLLRNKTAFELAKEIGLAYTPDAKLIDVYANGEYLGNYLLCEKIEVGKDRVDITNLESKTQELNPNCKLKNFPVFCESSNKVSEMKGYRIANDPEDISGGYILELDIKKRYDLETSGFTTLRKQCVVIKSPGRISYKQLVYIASIYQEFEDAVFAVDGVNVDTGKHYSEYIDIDSFARKYLLEEVAKNLDSAFTSQYIYKPEDTKSSLLYAGPIWDYDKSMGCKELAEAEGMYANRAIEGTEIWGEIYPHENLWYALYQHDDFRERVVEIYNREFRQIVLAESTNRVSKSADELLDSAMMNAIRWESFPDSSSVEEKQREYQREVDALVGFLKKRVIYLDQIWN